MKTLFKELFKRVISVVLSYVMVITMFPFFTVVAYAATYEGTGTESDPYVVSTGAELISVLSSYNTEGTYIKLDKDITLGSSYVPGTLNVTLDGDFHKITAQTYFCSSNKGVLKNFYYTNTVAMENAVSSYQGTGVLACSNYGTISGVIVTGTINNSCGKDSSYGCGGTGIVAGYNSGTIVNCAAFGSVTGSCPDGYLAGGIAGSGTVTNSYAVVSVSASGGSRYGSSKEHPITLGTVKNSYYNSEVESSSAAGGQTTEYMKSLDFVILLNGENSNTDSEWVAHTNSAVNNGYPVLRRALNATVSSSKTDVLLTGTTSISLSSDVSNVSIYYTLNGLTPTIYDKCYVSPFTISSTTTVKAVAYKDGMYSNVFTFHYARPMGAGTKENPYLIDSEAAFRAIPELGNSAYYRLTKDIIFTDEIISLGKFYGHFDGCGYALKDVYTSAIINGIFAENYGIVENLSVITKEGAELVAEAGIARINHGVIYNCTFEGGVNSRSSYDSIGVIAGTNHGRVEKCSADGYLRADTAARAGGVIGDNRGTVKYCDFNGYVEVFAAYMSSSDTNGYQGYVAGFVGKNTGTIYYSNVTATSVHSSSKNYCGVSVGAFVGNYINTPPTGIYDCTADVGSVSYTYSYTEWGTNTTNRYVGETTGNPIPVAHTHDFSCEIAPPICGDLRYAVCTCSCGISFNTTDWYDDYRNQFHNIVENGQTEPTQTADGTKYYKCTLCSYTETEPIHVWDEGVIADTNKKTFTCVHCGTVETQSVSNVYCGVLGDLIWELDPESGLLVISGSGEMNSLSSSSGWLEYESYIKAVKIESGVTSIGYRAFDGCSNLTSISIPDSVTSIGAGAFDGCSSLTVISIPENVTSIGDYAFRGCSSLVRISIPEGVTSIGSIAFSGCSALTSISIPSGLTVLGADAFNGCASLNYNVYNNGRYLGDATNPYLVLIGVLNTGAEEFVISENTRFIYDKAFLGCSALLSIVIPGGVTSIGASAFSGCTALTAITMADSVTSIGSNAFYGCSALSHINIPSGITSIASGTFTNCKSLTEIEIPNTVTSIGSSAFSGCSALTSVTVPDTVTSIGSGAFAGCSGLTSITLPFVGTFAFRSYSSYDTLFGYIFGTTSYTGGVATTQYYSSSSARTYYIPESLTSVTVTGGEILYGAFYGCSNLTSVILGKDVTSVGSHAFSGCSSLQSLTVPFVGTSGTATSASASTLFGYIFGTKSYTGGVSTKQSYSSSSTTYYIPSSLTSVTVTGGKLLYGAFYNCNNLVNVTLAEGVTDIGQYAFYYCSKLKEVVLPNSLSSIATYAIYSCSALSKIVYCGTADEWGSVSKGSSWKYSCNSASVSYHNYQFTSLGEANHTGSCLVCGDYVESAPHSWKGSVTTQPTHSTEGVKTFTCACGETYTEPVAVIPHTWDDGVITTEPTCFTEGVKTFTCACGATKEEPVEPIGHHYVQFGSRVEATLYTIENDKAYPFRLSSGLYTSTNKAHSTTSTFTINVEHNCEIEIAYYVSSESGWDKLIICKNGVSVDTISGNTTETSRSISVSAGDIITIQYKKDGSGASGQDEAYFKILTEALGIIDTVQLIPTDEIDATCTQPVICSGCDAEVKPVIPHDWDEGVITTAPTHMTEGVKTYTCSCGATSTGPADKLAEHEWDDGLITVRPTHTTEGERTFNCVCGEFKTEPVAKLTTHIWDDGVITTEPTHTSEGVKTFNCICGEIKTEAVAKLTDHEWDDGVVTTEPTHTAEGVKTFTCSCGDTKTEAVAKLADHEWDDGVVTTEPTHTAEGVKTYTCICGDTRTEAVEKLAGHEWDEGTVTTEPTHTSLGEKLFTCACGETRTETLDKLPDHEWDDGVVVGENTKEYTCTGCFETKTDVAIGGYCGLLDGLVWELDSATGRLVISGTGDMQNFANASTAWLAYKAEIRSVVIESGVTGIGNRAFYYCTALTDIEIPEGITRIGNNVFMYCSSLANIELPTSLTSIGNSAFSKCSALTMIELPVNVATLGIGVFADSTNLSNIYATDGNTAYVDVNGVLFTKDMNTLVSYPAGKTETSYAVPSGVTMIGDYAFEYCTALTSVTLPNSVEYIGYYAFRYCTGLNTVTVYNKDAAFDLDVFYKASADLTIQGVADSTAESYANENGHSFSTITLPGIKFLSASLSLYNDIAVNFKANKEVMDAAGFTDAYAVFEFNGNTYTVRDYTVETMMVSGVETEVYVFAFKNLTPDRMNDTITATLHAAFNGEDHASNSVSYSVAKYCYNQLKKCTEKTALATVCVDLLNYGSATQEYTGYRTDALANADLTDAQKAWGTQDTREFKNVTDRVDAPAVETAKWKSAALKLRENITVEMKFEAADITGLYVEVEMYGHTYRIDEFGYDETYGWYVVEFDKFSATHMSEIIKATVRDADGNAVSKVLTYSVESYAYKKQNDDVIGDLVKAMMKYGDAAIAYGAEQN